MTLAYRRVTAAATVRVKSHGVCAAPASARGGLRLRCRRAFLFRISVYIHTLNMKWAGRAPPDGPRDTPREPRPPADTRHASRHRATCTSRERAGGGPGTRVRRQALHASPRVLHAHGSTGRARGLGSCGSAARRTPRQRRVHGRRAAAWPTASPRTIVQPAATCPLPSCCGTMRRAAGRNAGHCRPQAAARALREELEAVSAERRCSRSTARGPAVMSTVGHGLAAASRSRRGRKSCLAAAVEGRLAGEMLASLLRWCVDERRADVLATCSSVAASSCRRHGELQLVPLLEHGRTGGRGFGRHAKFSVPTILSGTSPMCFADFSPRARCARRSVSESHRGESGGSIGAIEGHGTSQVSQDIPRALGKRKKPPGGRSGRVRGGSGRRDGTRAARTHRQSGAPYAAGIAGMAGRLSKYWNIYW